MSRRAQLHFLGHSTVLIDMDGVRVLTDPVLRDRIGHLVRRSGPLDSRHHRNVDAVVISHAHWDHLDVPSLWRLDRGTRLYVPVGARRLVEAQGFYNVVEMAAGESDTLGPITIRATPALHSGFRPPFGPLAGTIGFLLEGTERIYFAGDTDMFPEMAEFGDDLDVALLPVWGWGPTLGRGHMDPHRAAMSLALLTPRIAVPIHWGTLWPMGMERVRTHRFELPATTFAAHAAELTPAVSVRPTLPGDRVPRGR